MSKKTANTPLKPLQTKEKKAKGQMDYIFLLLVFLLLTIGLVSLFSSSFANALYYKQDSYHYISRQLLFGGAGVLVMLFVSILDYKILDNSKIVWGLYLLTIILLVGVFFFPPINDAQRWIHIGSASRQLVTFQPSEIAKFTVVVVLAHMINLNHDRMHTRRYGVIPPVVAVLPILLLIIKEPHLSATMIIVLIAATMLFIGGVPLQWFALFAAIVGGAVAIIAISGKIQYVLPRFDIWRDPWSDPRNMGYQIIQSLYAIGSGGLMGEGIGGSKQKYLYLPELQNDYIFAIVCEEVGFIGATVIILLFALLIWRGFLIGTRCKDRFGGLVAMGLTAQVGYQTILNILVVTNTIPPTGISLPFFSAGGTSLTMLLAQMGVVLAISRNTVDTATYTEEEFYIEGEAL